MEIFYEKNVVNENIDKHKKRNTIFNVVRIASVAILIIEIFFIFTFQVIPVDSGVLAIVLNIFISLLILAPPVLFLIVFSRLLSKLNAEYDYYILGDGFRIVKVFNRKKRKKFIEVPLSSISSIGLFESDKFERLDADKSIKKINAFCNEDSLLIYVFISHEGDKQVLLLEADDDFLINLRKAVPMSVFDDSVKNLIFKAGKQV